MPETGRALARVFSAMIRRLIGHGPCVRIEDAVRPARHELWRQQFLRFFAAHADSGSTSGSTCDVRGSAVRGWTGLWAASRVPARVTMGLLERGCHPAVPLGTRNVSQMRVGSRDTTVRSLVLVRHPSTRSER